MKVNSGFTVIEIIFVVVILSLASVLFFVQKNSVEVLSRDTQRKTAINAMYYGLEEVFYPKNKYYPQSISKDNLKSVDPDLFTDPDGYQINTAGSTYLYSPIDCSTDGKCKGYSLSTALENEDDFVKENRN